MTAADWVSSVANATVAGTAVTALLLAWRQLGLSRELSALEAYENYHLVCLQYPQFSNGNIDFERFDEQTLRTYEMYVLYTLMMDERIYALFPKDAGWLFSIKDDIRLHRSFISSIHFSEHLARQGWTILPIITEVLAEPIVTARDNAPAPRRSR